MNQNELEEILKDAQSIAFFNSQLGMSENGVYPQWNSHLIGIMIINIINHWV